MLNRVVMDVIQVMVHVIPVTDHVFPKPLLPHTAASIPPAGIRDGTFPAAKPQPSFGKRLLYDGKPPGKIAVTFRQRPQGMQVVRQKDHGVDGKRMLAAAGRQTLPQQPARPLITQKPRAAVRNEREEERPTGNISAPIFRRYLSRIDQTIAGPPGGCISA